MSSDRSCLVKVKMERDCSGGYRVIVQRAKYKHWFEFGRHLETDQALRLAILNDRVEWPKEIKETDNLFNVK